MSTILINIPEIINGNWSGKMVKVIVPNTCSKCGSARGKAKNVNNPQYGSIVTARCPTIGCKETYEDMRLFAEKSKNGAVAIPSSFFKPKMDPWQPDTIVGSGHSSLDGMVCSNKYCNEFVPYAAANQTNGSFICRRCRVI